MVQGSIDVDPSFWFFQAHFYQDPVWPGSLGLESFLQLLKFVGWHNWSDSLSTMRPVALGTKHEWIYRGQVVPSDKTVTVVCEIIAIDRETRTLTANGFLTVDPADHLPNEEFHPKV